MIDRTREALEGDQRGWVLVVGALVALVAGALVVASMALWGDGSPTRAAGAGRPRSGKGRPRKRASRAQRAGS
jgi:hypothetical protein